MTVVHSSPALHTTHRSTQECLETYARTEENPVLLGQALDEYTNMYLQQLEPHLAQQLAQALAAGCTFDKCAEECRSLSEHEELFAGIRTDEAAELHEMISPTDEAEYADENDPEEGASTAEYGIVMLAAVGFAGLLVAILKSDEIRGMLVDMVKNALATGGSGLTFGLF